MTPAVAVGRGMTAAKQAAARELAHPQMVTLALQRGHEQRLEQPSGWYQLTSDTIVLTADLPHINSEMTSPKQMGRVG